MKKLFFLSAIFLLLMINAVAQPQSPEQFLGYKIGITHTRHNDVVAYLKHVEQKAPQMVKLQQYGKTIEGRPLYLAFISSASHISNLENIRLNNLRLAKQSEDNSLPNTVAPAIVWLSYNVHGNETSSTEAALLTLYALVDPSNTQTKQWLQNTVIIIDPCLNPDGRERYINWYTSVVGKNHDATPYAREHAEPWPGGRSNHYYFDLNRDWAWQTQLESRLRVKQYNQWLPQIHVDFHEQGYNSPYYFAPAAEPYHEAITSWQREFQKTIGRNHAKYFDQKGWLYFTGEWFDLLYPSYGDTYPTYNGSIGMTYEQAGIGAGLAVVTADGDTLTLKDRAEHHYTSSLSTIETASQHAAKLLSEFQNYFATDHSGLYKSYIIKYTPEDRERINTLLQFFKNNQIEYGRGAGSGLGFNYHTGKNASYTISDQDVVVSGTQPKSALVRVLFDPNPKLADSITYDITSWALPYAYGVQAYASTKNIKIINKGFSTPPVPNQLTDAYGYIIRWQGVQSVSAVAQLLKQGIKVRYAEAPFHVGTQAFPAGSAIILKNANNRHDLLQILNSTASERNVEVVPVSTGMVDKGFDFGSSRVYLMKAPKVVLLTGHKTSSLSVGDIWHFMNQELDYPVTLVDAEQIEKISLNQIDVIIIPDGYYSFGEVFTERLATWVRSGGKMIAFENGAAFLSKQKWSNVKLKTDDKPDSAENSDPYNALKVYEDRMRNPMQDNNPGSVLKVDVDNTHPLMFGYPKHYYSLKMDTNLYEFIKEDGWNVGVIKKESQLSGFVGYKLKPRLQDALVFGVQHMGRGSVVYFTDNVLFRNFWENGKLMFANALFLVRE